MELYIRKPDSYAHHLRCLLPPSPPEALGPIPGRGVLIYVNGLTWTTCGRAEPMILRALRDALAARFGDAPRLERRYMHGERVGYLTYLQSPRDIGWLRLLVATLGARARLADRTLTVAAP